MELRHLRYFVAVAEELHFGRAAARLHIAQPPLSRQIRDLEREVGTPLFERVARGVVPTAAGRAFLVEARLTLAQAERALRGARRAAQGETGRLRVGFVEAATSSGLLPDVLGFFRLHLPNVGLSLFEMRSSQQEEALRDDRIDVGLLHDVPADADRWLSVEPVYEDPIVVALSSAHPAAKRARLTLADLAGESFVLFPRETAPTLYDELIARCRAAGFSPRVVQEAFAWHTATALVAAEVGVAFVPRSFARHGDPTVHYRKLSRFAVTLQLAAAWKRGRQVPVRERFVTALRAVARGGARTGRRAR